MLTKATLKKCFLLFITAKTLLVVYVGWIRREGGGGGGEDLHVLT